MVFIGGWRSRRRGYGSPYGGYRGGYGGGFGGGYGRNSSCLRDAFLLEGGCCLAELIGCGPQLVLLAPQILRRPWASAGEAPAQVPSPRGLRGRLLALVLTAIRRYQAEISPRRRASCRYAPTCSHYAAEAFERHGLRRGAMLTARRLLSCRPGTQGGPDPVPSA